MPTTAQELHKKFWRKFNDACKYYNCGFSLHDNNLDKGYYDIVFKNSHCYLSLVYNTKENIIECGLYIKNDKNYYDYLEQNKVIINNSISNKLVWERPDNKKASRIRLFYNNQINKNGDNWNEACEWLYDTVNIFIDVFTAL